MVEALLATYCLALAGLAFATWSFAFETRKTFRGGIFWGAWRIIGTALPFFILYQLVEAYEAVNGSTSTIDAIAQSFEALAFALLLLGFYLFYKAWNPRAMAGEG